jgi:hypothetical protein
MGSTISVFPMDGQLSCLEEKIGTTKRINSINILSLVVLMRVYITDDMENVQYSTM